MDEIEVPLEQSQEHINHAALHADSKNQSMMSMAAVLSAFLAVAAAISALFSGHYANEAMIEQIRASDQWAYYQAKGIKAGLVQMHYELSPSEKLKQKIEVYKEEQEKINEKANVLEESSRHHLHLHESLAASVTLFQVAIALTAIAVLTRRKHFLWVSTSFGLLGLLWMLKTLFT
ncbi:MAG: DUF4337 domain-containing protein [Bdellovibrionaceae bacterium]|nr:DUF4337 domain-containing protein [Bdellovibrio sp.]